MKFALLVIFYLLVPGHATAQELASPAASAQTVFRVLSESTVQQKDGSSVTFRRVVPPAVAAQAQAAVVPAPTLGQMPVRESKVMSISASVHANGFTVLRWTCGESQWMQAVIPPAVEKRSCVASESGSCGGGGTVGERGALGDRDDPAPEARGPPSPQHSAASSRCASLFHATAAAQDARACHLAEAIDQPTGVCHLLRARRPALPGCMPDRCAGLFSSVHGISNVDFRYLQGRGTLETAQTSYILILSAGPDEQALTDAEARAAMAADNQPGKADDDARR